MFACRKKLHEENASNSFGLILRNTSFKTKTISSIFCQTSEWLKYLAPKKWEDLPWPNTWETIYDDLPAYPLYLKVSSSQWFFICYLMIIFHTFCSMNKNTNSDMTGYVIHILLGGDLQTIGVSRLPKISHECSTHFGAPKEVARVAGWLTSWTWSLCMTSGNPPNYSLECNFILALYAIILQS